MLDLLRSGITFKKTGAEVKVAVRARLHDLEQRLRKRNALLDELLNDKQRLRSYLVRDPESRWPSPGMQMQCDVPSEDYQEILELCRRVFVLERELANLRTILSHLRDEQEFDLTFEQMVSYGFRQETAESGASTDLLGE